MSVKKREDAPDEAEALNNNNEVEEDEEAPVVYRDGYNWVSVDRLKPNPWNPNVMDHDELQRLKVNLQAGKYDPLVITPVKNFYKDTSLPGDEFIIVDGEQRWAGAQELGLQRVKCDVKHMTEAEAREECYSRGKVRGQLDPIKEGELFNLEVEDLGSEEAVAQKHNVSRSYVAGRRSLTRVAEPVKLLLRERETAFVAIKEAEIAAYIVESNPDEEYTKRQMEEMVASSMEQDNIVPRGTLTPSHMEALVGLEENVQKQIAAKVVEENLTVRDTETVVRLVKERILRKKRFEVALEKAVQKMCPACGGTPKDFEEKSRWSSETGGREVYYDEESFTCSKSGWHDWNFMKDSTTKEQSRQEAISRERGERLKRARENPAYIRRVEVQKDLMERISPWVLRKVLQLEKIFDVSVKGMRADGTYMDLKFPSSYDNGLWFRSGVPREEGDTSGYRMTNEITLSFGIENKDYKRLPFNSKIGAKASPEGRALVHYFFDTILETDLDPSLPEDPEEVRKILARYGELEGVCPICGKEEEKCTCMAIEKAAYEGSGEVEG